ADDHSLGLFPSPRRAAAAITTTRPGSAHGQSSGWPISLDSIATRRGRQCGGGSTWITRKGLRPEGWPRPFVIDATAASFLLILHYRGLRRKEFLDMCDYSLHSVRTRPAKVGEKLVTHNFGTGTRGFAAPEDCSVAVCVLPGTELAFEAPVKRQTTFVLRANTGHTVAIFRQINKGALHTNHDALEFPDGEIVL